MMADPEGGGADPGAAAAAAAGGDLGEAAAAGGRHGAGGDRGAARADAMERPSAANAAAHQPYMTHRSPWEMAIKSFGSKAIATGKFRRKLPSRWVHRSNGNTVSLR